MIWSDSFTYDDGKIYKIHAKSLSPFTDSRRLVFTITGDEDWNLELVLSDMAALQLEGKSEHLSPEGWLWKTGLELIRRSIPSKQMMDGEFIISDSDLCQADTLTVSELSKLNQIGIQPILK